MGRNRNVTACGPIPKELIESYARYVERLVYGNSSTSTATKPKTAKETWSK